MNLASYIIMHVIIECILQYSLAVNSKLTDLLYIFNILVFLGVYSVHNEMILADVLS